MPIRGAASAAAGLVLLAPVLHAQSVPESEIAISAGAQRLVIARLAEGALTPSACLPVDAPPDPTAPLTVTAPVAVTQPRAVRIGSDEWTEVSPLVLALAERREREQRLVQATTSKAPHFLDWLFASDAAGAATYYFEASRRVPSIAAPIDVDVDTDPPGTIRIVVSGFARRTSTGLTPLGTKGELRWEQDDLPRGPSRPDLRPLGVLALPGDPVWIMESRTPASSAVNFFRVGGRGTTLQGTTRLGGC